ncbi:MAG: hypothetical protein M1823_008780, partial [Watsoniomyces obsoletus]
MGGDAAHHAAEWRPSPFLPLPEEISPHPFAPISMSKNVCPGEMFSAILANGPTKPVYGPTRKEVGQVHHDVDETIRTIEKMQEYDAENTDNILVAVAHDETLLDV